MHKIPATDAFRILSRTSGDNDSLFMNGQLYSHFATAAGQPFGTHDQVTAVVDSKSKRKVNYEEDLRIVFENSGPDPLDFGFTLRMLWLMT